MVHRAGCCCLVVLWLPLSLQADWPQFRGPGGKGLAASSERLPTEIGPNQQVLWRTTLPPGHSSPVIVGDRIFVTAAREETLLTIALERATGRVLWERVAPHDKLESIHSIGSYAQSTPAADASCVVSFFGSSGLWCYDHDGKLLWQRRMGPFNNSFGAGSSPILVEDRVILGQDHDTDSFLMALDKATGEVLWKTDRSEFPRNYCTPVLWEHSGRRQVVMAATLRVVGYDFHTGQEVWTVRGISRTVCMTPVVGADGALYVAGWAAGGDEGEPIIVEPFDLLIGRIDKNGDGRIQESELSEGAILQRYDQVDRNKDGALTRAEYEYFRGLFEQGRNQILAIEPGPRGEATETHVRWRHTRLVPFCASPLYLDGHVFTIKDGGLAQVLDARTGKPLRQMRLEAAGNYYASPVAGDGKVYLADERGRVTVLNVRERWEVVHTADFGEEIYATPALVDGRVYVRTTGALYCFGE